MYLCVPRLCACAHSNQKWSGQISWIGTYTWLQTTQPEKWKQNSSSLEKKEMFSTSYLFLQPKDDFWLSIYKSVISL